MGGAKGTPADEALRELTLRARGGDRDAAYEVLGKQVPTSAWVAVIESLARDPEGVDLEVVAHRTLRRPPADVPLAVVRLAEGAGTAQAAFVAHAVAELRSEEHVKGEALRVAAALSARNDPIELLSDDRPTESLYALLSLSLSTQREVLATIGAEDPARDALIDVVRAEYERLQELSRDTRWRSGSYRHFLRHRLADLALIAHVGGKLEDQAFRLLQQRTDNPQANGELLALLPEATRRAYLSWVVERPAGKEETARALFALHEIEHRYPEAVDRASIARLLESKSTEIASAAARLLVRSEPHDSSNDRALAELVGRASLQEREVIVTMIARDAPRRVRLDLWPIEVDPFVASARSHELTEHLVTVFEGSDNAGVRRRALALLRERVNPVLARRVAVAVVARTMEPDSSEISAMVDEPNLRAALWSAVSALDTTPRRLLGALVHHETAEGGAVRLSGLYDDADEAAARTIEDVALEGLEDGAVAADPLQGSALAAALADRAERRVGELRDRLAEVSELVSHGDRAARLELQRELQAIVTRAVERSTGNDRLIADYRRLVDAADVPVADGRAAPTPALEMTEVEAAASSLAKVGVRLTSEGDRIVSVADREADDLSQLRALALADQRCERATEELRPTAARIRDAVANALAQSGLAKRGIRDVAMDGPLASPIAALPPTAQWVLFNAALDSGVTPEDDWLQHPIIGRWMTSRASELQAGCESPFPALRVLQQTAAELRAVEERLAESRRAARRELIASSESALRDLEQTFDAYIQAWLALERIGIHRVAAIGEVLRSESIDPSRHEVVGDVRSDRYIVRSGGVAIGDEVIRRARVEAYS